MIVTSYYTNDEYRKHADGLKLALDSLGLDHDVRAVSDLGSPEANRAHKPLFLLDMMDAYPGEIVLWLDADSTIYARPTLLDGIGAFDLACFYWTKGKPWNGTLCIWPTENARAAIATWAMLNEDGSHDMANFQRAMEKSYDFKVYHLPPAYCYVRRWMKGRWPGVIPIIEHQAVSVK